jgi:FkbM family methyltransferase
MAAGLKARAHAALVALAEQRAKWTGPGRTLRRLRAQALGAPRHQPGVIDIDGLRVQHIDLMSVYMEYKDIFCNRIYHFDATTPAPRIIDGGGYIGMSTLYFKTAYPQARVWTFEPDPALADVLEQNVRANGLADVEVVRAGLAETRGSAGFLPDGADGGKIVASDGDRTIETVPLSGYLQEPVDFLKLNIEGFELPVLLEAEQDLRNVRELVLEYHGWPNGDQRLGEILSLLDRQGFRYLVNHFDYQTNGAVRPPFKIGPDTTWFCLVYARRADDA